MARITQEEDVPLIVLVNVLLRHAPLTLGIPLLFFTVIVVVGLLQPRTYTAEARFMPESAGGGSASRIPGLAAQFGIEIGGGGGESLDFYVQLLSSRELLAEAAQTAYSMDDRAEKIPLTRLYGDELAPTDGGLRKTIDRLRDDVVTRMDSRAGIITLTTHAPSPDLAVQLNLRLLELVNEYNVQTRQSRARAEREFTEARIQESASALRQAEQEMERFLEQNRHYELSPTLRFEASRLERAVTLHQQLHNTHLQSYERARLAEIRDIPVITVIDSPEGSEEVAGRGLAVRGLLGLILGGLLGLGIAFGKEYVSRERRRNPEEYAQFDELRPLILRRWLPGRRRVPQVLPPVPASDPRKADMEPAGDVEPETETVP